MLFQFVLMSVDEMTKDTDLFLIPKGEDNFKLYKRSVIIHNNMNN